MNYNEDDGNFILNMVTVLQDGEAAISAGAKHSIRDQKSDGSGELIKVVKWHLVKKSMEGDGQNGRR